MFKELNSIKSGRKELKKFGFTIGFILMMVGVFLFVKEKDSFIYFFSIGSIFIGLGIIISAALKTIYNLDDFCSYYWMGNDKSNLKYRILSKHFNDWNICKISWKRFFKFEIRK